ncbi:MAG: hypothetical protein K2I18_03005 [Paramuribaculum sp.]|nr:hypothetical protein [Paramuribaculum sp.]
MENELSTWNNYPVYGNAAELDVIVESENMISLDRYDLIRVLSAGYTNRIATGIGATLGEALDAAVNALPYPLSKPKKLIISIQYGDKQPKMSELSKITEALSDTDPDLDVVWGVTAVQLPDSPFKVVLLAAAEE